jgi:hypothetical protein
VNFAAEKLINTATDFCMTGRSRRVAILIYPRLIFHGCFQAARTIFSHAPKTIAYKFSKEMPGTGV